MGNKRFWLGILVMVLVFGMATCELFEKNEDETTSNSGGSGGGSKTPGSTKENAILVTVGYSSSHTISRDGQHWFKFVGTGDTVIFETTGNVVDTYISVFEENAFLGSGDDNSGEGDNALLSKNTTSGTTYFIRIETRQGTSGAYTLTVKATSPVNIRTNPILVTVGYSSSYNISGGQYWYGFQGTGNSVIFETESNVVNTTVEFYIGSKTSAIVTDKSRISFSTVSGTMYYIKITSSNSGTYIFKVRNGIGDGSSKSNAISVTVGYSSSHTISRDGTHWFSFLGTGDTVKFETTGNVVDTYISVFEENAFLGSGDDNSGEGDNALLSKNTTSGTTYFIRIETRQGTSGTYIFVVE